MPRPAELPRGSNCSSNGSIGTWLPGFVAGVVAGQLLQVHTHTAAAAAAAGSSLRVSAGSASGAAQQQHFCPWDTSQSAFTTPSRVIDYGAGQTACQDAVIYGYDVLFERDALFGKTKWLGVPNQQDPVDAMMFQEILWTTKPDVVIELGTNTGGGALFYASVMSLWGNASRVITIDPKGWQQDWYTGDRRCLPDNPCLAADSHPLWNKSVTFIQGVPTEPAVLRQVSGLLSDWRARTVVVVEDSNHQYDVVLANMLAYGPLVTPGSYMIVQDTKLTRFPKSANCAAKPTQQERLRCLGDHAKVGPGDAVADFLKAAPEFSADRSWEFLHYTQHAGGFLKRRGAAPTPRRLG